MLPPLLLLLLLLLLQEPSQSLPLQVHRPLLLRPHSPQRRFPRVGAAAARRTAFPRSK
jgi:hypothetical protein